MPNPATVREQRLRKTKAQLIDEIDSFEQRVTALEVLLESEGRFRSAFETAGHGMNLTAPDGRILAVNNALCEMLGYSEEELLATDIQSATHPEDLDRDLANLRALLAGEIHSYQLEKRYVHKQGHPIDVLLSVSLIRDSNGEPLYSVGHIQDITERRRAEEALREMKTVLDNMPAAAFLKSLDGQFRLINRKYEELYGITFDSVRGRTLYDIHPKELADDYTRFDRETIEAEEVIEREIMVEQDGEEHFLTTVMFPVFDQQGTITAFGGIEVDITDRKRAEEALAEKESQIRLVFDNMPGAIVYTDEELNLVVCNDRFADIYQAPRELLQPGRPYPHFVRYLAEHGYYGEGDVDAFVAERVESLRNPSDKTFETRMPDGHIHQVRRRRVAAGGTVTVITDITELKRAEQELAEKDAKLRVALANMPGAIVYTDEELNLVVCNDHFADIYQAPKELLQPGCPYPNFVRYIAEHGYYGEGDVDAFVAERVESLRNPSDKTFETRTPDGHIHQVRRRRVAAGGTVTVITDITELKRAEEELQAVYGIIKNQKERMESELKVGHEIQMSMVPLTFPAFPDRKEFSIYGSLEPAREIGGDFYDFFFIDEERICFCIGDVSGKGVPAALFMAVTKTLIKSRATDDPSTASIVTHVNDELSRDNPNKMFVTLFIGILNIRSGEFDYTNAGHNPPYLMRTDGPPEAMSARHGPIVGAVNGMVYRKGTDVMHPGDILHMYTDGVTEEMDTDGQLFSDERLAALISTQTIDSVEAAVDKTISAVKSFRGEKDAEDDVTVLAIQFFGAPMKASAAGLHVIVKNELSEITTVQERFQEFGKTHGYSKDLERKMDMIIDELLGNVILYAFSEGGEHEIEITAEQVRNRLTVTISDDGIPFNPLLKAPPEISLAAKDRTIGGLGILLVRKMADDILYQRRIDKNVLTLIVHVDQSADAP